MTPEAAANKLAVAYATAEGALTDLEAAAKAFSKAMGESGSPIGPVAWAEIRGDIAGAAAAVARSHLAVTPYDPRPHPMDGGGGK